MELDHDFIDDLRAASKTTSPQCDVSISIRTLSTHLTVDVSIVRHDADLANKNARKTVINQLLDITKSEVSKRKPSLLESPNFSIRIGINPDYWSHRILDRFPDMGRTTYQLLTNRISNDPCVNDQDGNRIGSLRSTREAIFFTSLQGKTRKLPRPRAAAIARHGTHFMIITADESNPEAAIVLPPIEK